MSEYTKGPWSISETGPKWSINVGSGGDSNRHIAMVSCYQRFTNDHTENLANARLIAAAPELLEALQTLVDDCIHASGSMDYNYGKFDLKAAEAAILKARGETR